MDTIGMIGENVKEKAKLIPFLPDEIIINILIRLPARIAMRFRLVCRRWRNLTLNRDFVELNFKTSVPTILGVLTKPYCKLQLFALENWWESATTWNMAYGLPMNTLNIGIDSHTSGVLFSHAGLIVLQEETEINEKIIILNPARANSEYLSITLSEERSEIYGVYYHPSLKGYCSLWEVRPSGDGGGGGFLDQPNYKILNLGFSPYLKTISNPFSSRVKMENAVPLLINNFLYWKLQSEQEDENDGCIDIMKFDIISEEFTVIPCPISIKCKDHQTHLLNSDGILSFLLILPRKFSIWRLDGHADQPWTTVEYTLSMEICHKYEEIDVIAVVDGKLALQSNDSLWVCNLMEGSVRNYPRIVIPARISFLSHQMSLASLCNGKTTIFIEQDNKVVVT